MSEIDNLEWDDVVSSNLKRVAYNDTDNTLYIEFKDGSIYAYEGATYREFQMLQEVDSPGSYFATNIRNLPTRKIA